MYRKPSSSIDNLLTFYESMLCQLKCEHSNIFIAGDFNIDILKQVHNTDAINFLSVNSSYGFLPFIKTSTRITFNSATLIDNIFTNVIDKDFVTGSFCVDISDHLPIFLLSRKLTCKGSVSDTQSFSRKITDDGTTALRNELYITDWSSLYCSSDANAAYELFYSRLENAFDKYLPLTRNTVKKILYT